MRLFRRKPGAPVGLGRRRSAAVAVVAVALFATGASAETIPAGNDTFKGIAFLGGGFDPSGKTGVSAERPLRILITHGMGTAREDGFDAFLLEVAGKFGLVQMDTPPETAPAFCHETRTAPPNGLTRPEPVLIAVDAVPAADRARLYTYRFARPRARDRAALTVSYLIWSPLTCGLKTSRAVTEFGHPQRQPFADWAKDFIDDKFADVVLYNGGFKRRVLRPTVEKAMCLFVGGAPDDHEFIDGVQHPDGENCQGGTDSTPSVLITHSLGSYMLVDAIGDELTRAAKAPETATAAGKLLRSSQFIYMMANQLPLLDLSRLAGFPSDAGAAADATAAPTAQDARAPRPPSAMARFGGDLKTVGTAAPRLEEGRVFYLSQVVAFSDPNDILSYLLTSDALGLQGDDKDVFLTNVYVHNGEFQIPLLFSDPNVAHTGYFTNSKVLDLLICGMDHGAVKQPCPAGHRR
jgi:hypothetical protein